MNRIPDVAVMGAGAWGTALGIVAARRGCRVRVWALEPEVAHGVRMCRENTAYLPGVEIPRDVVFSTGIEEVVSGAEFIITTVPSQHSRGVFESMVPFVSASAALVSGTKGIEIATLKRMSEIMADVFRSPSRSIAVLSGPSFARETALNLPTVLTVAAQDMRAAMDVQQALSGERFRVYTSNDVIGVELGGALKNIIALAAGIVHGLGLGANAMAALITRGLAEIMRLGVALGGRAETLSGLSGLGDLVLTCTGALSRNRAFGVAIGKGKSPQEAGAGLRTVAEGVATTLAAVRIAEKEHIEMPITEQVHAILYQGKDPATAVKELMGRTLKQEFQP